MSHTAVPREDFVRGRSAGVALKRSFVDSGYFRTMGIRLLRGREFEGRDVRSAPPVTVVNETLARRLSPDGDVVGMILTLINNFPSINETPEQFQVVGIVNDVDPILLDRDQAPVAYMALGQQWNPSPDMIVAQVPPSAQQAALAEVSRAVAGADLFAEVSQVRTMDQIVSEVLYPRRMAAAVLAASAGIGLLLAAVGLYGVISYSIAQRRHELAVRTALGARRADITALVLREGSTVMVTGTCVGAALSYAAVQVARGRIENLPPLDWPTILVVPLVLGAVVLAASYLPARRALRVDPLDSLRSL
jgi:putative ABC transport system permease protein